MQSFVRIVDAASRAAGLASIFLLVAALLVVCQMVFLRYVFRSSTIWQTEFVIYSIVAATFLGSAYVLLLKGHVNVDLLPNALPKRGRLAMEIASAVLSLLFCGLLAWSGWLYFHEAWTRDWTTSTVWALPLWIPLLPLPLGIGLLSLQYVAELWKLREELR